MKILQYPFREEEIRTLTAGEAVSICGTVKTGRDKFHKYFADGGEVGDRFKDGALYHCGPVVVREGREWKVMAAGPTTSVRENPYEPAFIRKSGVRIIIGKGGMDAETLKAMAECGCVYVQAVGGAAAVSAAAIKKVKGVEWLEEFGAAEAVWEFEVEDFRGVVAMDAHGRNLFAEVEAASKARLEAMR